MNLTKLVLGAAAGAMALVGGTAATLEGHDDTITAAYFLEWPTANQVAQLEKTYDEALGVDLEWRAFGNGNEMTQATVSGDVHIAYS
tara:strand:- start:7325 stop:7585 length:261 start_codon:yes stop_codon:yes gene_type:complete